MGTTPAGRLQPVTDAPAAGEVVNPIVAVGKLVVEQILSAPSTARQEYLQEEDEWAVVLAGAAVLEIAGEQLELGAGDWVFLPAGIPHTVVETAAATSWLAVRLLPG